MRAAGTLVSYIEAVTNAPPGAVREFFRQLGPKGEEAYMTGAEILMQQGREQGLAQGRAEGQAMLLLRQLSLKFGPLAPEIDDRVRAATAAELERWAERVLSAATLDAVFEG